MTDKVIFNLIRNSSSPLTLVKHNGDIVFNSRVFDNFIADKLPYESNFLEMLMHTNDVVNDIHEMYKEKKINLSKFPQEVKIKNNNKLSIALNSTLSVNNEDFILFELQQNTGILDSFTESLIQSENLFIKKKGILLIYDFRNKRIIAINNATQDFINDNDFDNNELPENIKNNITEIVEKARIGGVSSQKSNLQISGREKLLSFECCGIDTNYNYYLVSIVDETINKRENEIITLDKNRAHNIIDVVPGILFEFEIKDAVLTFTYISESIKSLIGLSAGHILNDSKKLFSYLNKLERARLHYFFTTLTEEERKIRNEFKIIDHNNNTKWITINWHETHSDRGNIKGTGYIDDITEKKKIEIQKRENAKRKELKDYFSLSLLRHSSTSLLLKDLAVAVVTKLGLQDLIIYIYNSNSKKLEYATSYSSITGNGTRTTYPKEISSAKGIIGRVVKSQKSEIINYSSDDTDYYFIDKPSESEITVPIIFEGELLGVIDSEHKKPKFFTEEHLRLLEDISETLAIRLVQKKRQDDNLKFHSTLSLLYSQGKIFNFNFDIESKSFNNSCIDNIIDLIGIKETSKKIEIYNDSKILLDYVLQYDVVKLSILEESLENSVVETREVTFRIITELGYIKWLKMIVSNFNKDKSGKIFSIDGTIQDVTNIKELETSGKKIKDLQTSIKESKHQLAADGDILKSIDTIGNALNVSEIIISKLDTKKNNRLVDKFVWNKDKSNFKRLENECIFSNINDFEEKLKSNLILDTSDFDEISKPINEGINSFISIPIKTPNGLWGAITFIGSKKTQEWKDYEKNLLVVYANLISLYI
jgi:GAF domain-containing protein/PAS domain-containing protein